MDTLFAQSADGTRIAYDRRGRGPAILLVHGGGGSRQDWHEAGYVDRLLQEGFSVISLDLRGHGQSDRPTEPAEYAADKMGQDVLAVADANDAGRFVIWAMSYGGRVSRALAARSERVTKLVLMGTPLGEAVSSQIRQEVLEFCAHWPPILKGLAEGTVERDDLPQEDRETLEHLDVPVVMAWGRAMIDWPDVGPADLRCPTLWLVGSEDEPAMASARENEASLAGSRVQLHIVEGLDHDQLFSEVEQVWPLLLEFTNS